MNETIITILGFSIPLRYTVYEGGHIEWGLTYKAPNELFNTLLRIHYTPYIEATLRKVWFDEEFVQHQVESAQLSLKDPTEIF